MAEGAEVPEDGVASEAVVAEAEEGDSRDDEHGWGYEGGLEAWAEEPICVLLYYLAWS